MSSKFGPAGIYSSSSRGSEHAGEGIRFWTSMQAAESGLKNIYLSQSLVRAAYVPFRTVLLVWNVASSVLSANLRPLA